MKYCVTVILASLFCAAASAHGAAVQPTVPAARPSEETAPLSFSSVATHRFVASHGRRAVLMGYPETGLEFWAYPLQIVSSYQVGFQSDAAATETDGRALLTRIIETPDAVTRIYSGPDYVVRETLFVPLDEPAAIVSYEVHSEHPLNIVIHLVPVLDLMWPAALGGQTVSWNADVPGYVMREEMHGFSAAIGSSQIIAHDSTVNSTVVERKLAFTIKPQTAPGSAANAPAFAKVLIAQVPAKQDPKGVLLALDRDQQKLKADATAHYQALQQDSLRIRTPDAALNEALAWSQIALDQAWVCNPDLGCGSVAGYGPSRPGRRPQYAWFFAGDGFFYVNALSSAGAFARAREELEFIARYQDAKTGMIWHELTQSAKYLDWEKYPYMFVHVDISFDYLDTVARYVSASGDTDFAIKHWDSIAAAYRYCQSLISSSDHLPHIPQGKLAGDEQHRPADDLSLSTAWVTATQSFSGLAKAAGHADLAGDALKANALARTAIAAHYWDARQHFWIDSHDAKGEPISLRGGGPGSAIVENIFTPEQNAQVLDQIASSAFQTDWGTRGIGSDSASYAPWSYATGSIFAISSTASAQLFWQEHRPQVAWSIFQGILQWTTLDAPGHIHEVLAGNYFRPQTESVPEQTWSSAALLDVAMRGLFGVEIRSARNAIDLHPHMPAEWSGMSVENIRLPRATLAFTLHHDPGSVDLDLRDTGDPAEVEFSPQIPLGADVVEAQCDGAKVPVSVMSNAQDTHAQLKLSVSRGESHCHLRLAGGVSIILPAPAAQIGDASTGIKLTRVRLQGDDLALDADVHALGIHHFRVQTPWKIKSITGADFKAAPDDVYEVQLLQRSHAQRADGYANMHVGIVFENP